MGLIDKPAQRLSGPVGSLAYLRKVAQQDEGPPEVVIVNLRLRLPEALVCKTVNLQEVSAGDL